MINTVAERLFNEFSTSSDTLRVYKGDECIFSSEKDVLVPLVEYIGKFGVFKDKVLVMDKVIGNAAALLAVQAGAKKVYSPLGSNLGVETLNKHHIEYFLPHLVPFILARNGVDLCPMEKLSTGKTPEDFYQIMKQKFQTDTNPVNQNPI